MAENVIINLNEFPRAPQDVMPVERPSVSILRRRFRRFRNLKRGYYCFLIMLGAYGISFFLPVFINNKALIVRYDRHFYFPLFRYYPAATFGQQTIGEPSYRELAQIFRQQNAGNWVVMPLFPYSATESILDLPGSPPHPPSRQHIFGTDDRGRDIFARLAYGFNVSLTF